MMPAGIVPLRCNRLYMPKKKRKKKKKETFGWLLISHSLRANSLSRHPNGQNRTAPRHREGSRAASDELPSSHWPARGMTSAGGRLRAALGAASRSPSPQNPRSGCCRRRAARKDAEAQRRLPSLFFNPIAPLSLSHPRPFSTQHPLRRHPTDNFLRAISRGHLRSAAIMSQTYSTAEVAKHKDEENGMWLIVENDVYDITSKRDPPPNTFLTLPIPYRIPTFSLPSHHPSRAV